MAKVENVLDMLGTIKRLRAQQATEPDPRVRQEIAETLDLLVPSYDRMVDRLCQELAKVKKAGAA